jgi:hypothetical protein
MAVRAIISIRFEQVSDSSTIEEDEIRQEGPQDVMRRLPWSLILQEFFSALVDRLPTE